jgi:hypothetical protein
LYKKQITNAQQANKKINDFCNNDNSKAKKQSSTKNKTVGFMFFNSNLALNIDGDKKSKVLLVDSN